MNKTIKFAGSAPLPPVPKNMPKEAQAYLTAVTRVMAALRRDVYDALKDLEAHTHVKAEITDL